jgi:hypothetical protein
VADNDDVSTKSQVSDRTATSPRRTDTDVSKGRPKSPRRRLARNGAAVNNHLRVRFATARFLG